MENFYQNKFLIGRRLKTFLAVAACIVPDDDEFEGAGTPATASVVDWALARMPENLRKKFLLLLMVVEILGVFFGGRFFSNNSKAAKNRQLLWMESGPVGLLRMGFFGLKNFACMGYFCREDVWKFIGYDGPVDPDIPFADQAIRKMCKTQSEEVNDTRI